MPQFFVRIRTVLVLTFVVALPLASLSAPGDEFWDNRFDALGIDGDVFAIAVMGNDVYVGGQFSKAGNIEATNIARWDGTNWWPLGRGIGELGVQALAVSGTNLYVGGMFTNAGGINANAIAKWDGRAWTSLGGGLNGWVRSLAVGGTDVYVGGRFSNASGIIANHIAKWDGDQWTALGSGVSFFVWGSAGPRDTGEVWALGADRGNLFVGGAFTKAGGLDAVNVAKWDGLNWSALGAGSGDLGAVQAFATIQPYLFVGGTFYPLRSMAPTNITRWDGTNWSYLGSGLEPRPGVITPYVRSFAVSGGHLFVGGGGFRKIGSTNVAKWNGFEWEGLGRGLSSGGDVNALAVKGNELYVGGQFTAAGGKPSRKFAIWHIPEKLSIRRSPNSVEVSWPASLSNFVLEASAKLPGTNWTEVRKAPALQNERFSITDERTAPQQFYRLRKTQ